MVSEADRIVGLYRRHAEAWAQDRGNGLIERVWLERFLDLLPNGASVLDIGCGSGEPIASHLILQGTRLTGVDSAPEMITMCMGRFPESDWHVTDMRTLSMGRAFDGILAWDSFFHLDHDDQRRMFPIFRTHAGPRTALMFTSGTSHGVAMGTYAGENLYHASLDPAEYRGLLN